jgi:cyclopropane fatty-acyl-phospholipid synthase-like methyltransferase
VHRHARPSFLPQHVKNYEKLLAKVAKWLKPGGLFFVHIFTHKTLPFHYTDGWMAKNFFSGGQVGRTWAIVSLR